MSITDKVHTALSTPITSTPDPGNVEVAEADPATAKQPTRVNLDDMREDLETLRMVQRLIADWQSQERVLKEKIISRLGPNGEGYLDGKPVWAHSPTQKFASKKFTTDNPQIAEQFTHAKVVQVLNEEELRKALPALYAQYQVSSLRPLGSRT